MVSLIIVDYRTITKTLHYMKECNKSFITSYDIHVIIVDNNVNEQVGLTFISDTEHAKIRTLTNSALPVPVYECICEDGSRITYVAARANIGYAKGNNLGAKVAKILFRDTYYLFSNNDLRFMEPIPIDILLTPMRDKEDVAVVGPSILSLDGSLQSPRKKPTVGIGLFVYYWNLLLPKRLKLERWITDIDMAAKTGRCDWVTGSFLITDAVKFHEVCGFDEHTFLFYEEVILAERLQKKSYRMYYTDSVKIVHEHGETVKSSFSILQGIDISFKSGMYYFRNYRNISKFVTILAYINYYLFRVLFRLKKAIGSLR